MSPLPARRSVRFRGVHLLRLRAGRGGLLSPLHAAHRAGRGGGDLAVQDPALAGFKTGAGMGGFIGHAGHEWVTLANLLRCCCWALRCWPTISRRANCRLPAQAAARRLEGRLRAADRVFVLSRLPGQHRRGHDRRHHGQHGVQGRVHIGYLAAIVAASNAGGAGSVVGDTTTTMMWIAGVAARCEVLEAYIASAWRCCSSACPAAKQQHAYQPIQKDARCRHHVDWTRSASSCILLAAVAVNVVQPQQSCGARPLAGPRHGRGGWRSWSRRRCAPDLEPAARRVQGQRVPAVAGVVRVDDAGGALPLASWQTALGLGFVSAVFDNIPLTALASSRAATTGASWPMRWASAAR
jgi:hypothetical protein